MVYKPLTWQISDFKPVRMNPSLGSSTVTSLFIVLVGVKKNIHFESNFFTEITIADQNTFVFVQNHFSFRAAWNINQ